MVTLLLDSTRLEAVLSPIEHTLSFRRQNVVIERSAIAKVQLTDDAWTWLRGVADPGTYVPVAVAMGSWKSASGRDFALIRRRRPSVVIDLEGHPEFQRVILTTRHGLALIQSLRLDAHTEPTDVAAIAAEAKKTPATKVTAPTSAAKKPARKPPATKTPAKNAAPAKTPAGKASPESASAQKATPAPKTPAPKATAQTPATQAPAKSPAKPAPAKTPAKPRTTKPKAPPSADAAPDAS